MWIGEQMIHDAVHVAVGGDGGHMSYPDVSAFDPIFFLHHCNVDRLFAIWQALHPNSWIPDDGVDQEGTFTQAPKSKVPASSLIVLEPPPPPLTDFASVATFIS